MAYVKIGHASIDERGKVSGGKVGDQTGKEVCVREWYDKGWDTVLRPLSPTLAEKSAQACEAACANNLIGYDQSKRNTLHDWAKANGYRLNGVPACSCDCSSFMTVCAIAGGADTLEYMGNAPTTSNMVAKFVTSGHYQALTAHTITRYQKYLRRGDILVKTGKHTAMVLSDGWGNGKVVTCEVTIKQLKRGDRGATVRAMQAILAQYGHDTNGIDGIFGAGTETAVKNFQKAKALGVDGICGAKTWAALING